MRRSTLSLLSLFLALVLLLFMPGARCEDQTRYHDQVLAALKKELDRSIGLLARRGEAPIYFIAYRAYNGDYVSARGSAGVLTAEYDSPSHSRYLQVEVRAGSEELDNYHPVRGQVDFSSSYSSMYTLPEEFNEAAIRNPAWQATDKAFKNAQKLFALARGARQVRVKEIDQSGDFRLYGPRRDIEAVADFPVQAGAFDQTVRRLSRLFNDYPFVRDSYVAYSAGREVRQVLTSEEREIRSCDVSASVTIHAETVAEDGMELWLDDQIETAGIDRLPPESVVEEKIKNLAKRLGALRRAPLAEPYAGPAILRGKAAGVFFHEVLGHRLEGHRQKNEDEGRTFRDKVGSSIMPRFITVVDDPTMKKTDFSELSGHYRYDDEAVPASRTVLVEDGVLKGFLKSRAPLAGFPDSNGHGRCSWGNAPVARQGNLMVLAAQSARVSPARLREMLIEQVRKQGKPYGLIFDDIAGGSTMTRTGEPQLYSLYPLSVTRVFADGRPDQLIRGVDIVGTPLLSLERIIAAGDDFETFNGTCGAESGWVPVSASSPSLLLENIEVERKKKSDDLPPILPDPGHDSREEKNL
ncbi:MAG: TldD/PmbA family protein [Candidatus Obscuribacterales bacterium]